MLTVLNAAGETPGPTRYLVTRNKPGTPDFVYNSLQDGALPGVPAEDRDGNPHDVVHGLPSPDCRVALGFTRELRGRRAKCKRIRNGVGHALAAVARSGLKEI